MALYVRFELCVTERSALIGDVLVGVCTDVAECVMDRAGGQHYSYTGGCGMN